MAKHQYERYLATRNLAHFPNANDIAVDHARDQIDRLWATIYKKLGLA